MDLRQLRTFVMVAEQGTVSNAALRLGVAQPALSRQIGALEAELGVRLFDRVRRRLILTGEGERLLGDCRVILGSVGSLHEHAQLMRRGDAGILKVAATPQTIDGIFSGFLHRFAAHRPNVQIKLSEAVGQAVPRMLERGEVHLGVSLLQSIQAGAENLETFALAPIEFLAVCDTGTGRRLGAAQSIDIRSLEAMPLLLLDTSFFVRTTVDAACRIAGIKPSIFIESRSPHALLSLAEAGHGVAIVPSVMPTHRYKVRIFRITDRHKPLREQLGLVWERRRALPRYAEDFRDALAAYVRAALPVSQPSRSRVGERSDGGDRAFHAGRKRPQVSRG